MKKLLRVDRYLGPICFRNHGYGNSGKSVRDKKFHQCVLCVNLRAAKWKKENKDRMLFLQKRWRDSRSKKKKKEMKKYQSKYYLEVTKKKRELKRVNANG